MALNFKIMQRDWIANCIVMWYTIIKSYFYNPAVYQSLLEKTLENTVNRSGTFSIHLLKRFQLHFSSKRGDNLWTKWKKTTKFAIARKSPMPMWKMLCIKAKAFRRLKKPLLTSRGLHTAPQDADAAMTKSCAQFQRSCRKTAQLPGFARELLF